MKSEKYDEYLQRAKTIKGIGDPEISHHLFDLLLCEILDEEYHEIVVEFKSMTKWYV